MKKYPPPNGTIASGTPTPKRKILYNYWAYAGKNVGGFKVMAGLVGGPGAEPPRMPENF